jgi:hypothetical protein
MSRPIFQVEGEVWMTPEGAERRAMVRYPIRRQAYCSMPCSVHYGRLLAMVRDISRSGIGLLVGRPFEVETPLIIEIPTAHGHPFQLLARVVYSTRQAESQWIVGCRLATDLTDDELQAVRAG